MKKVLLGILAILGIIIVVFVAGAWSMFGEKVTAAMTVTKVDEGLYSMSYEGDYGFDEYVKMGGGASAEEMAEYITYFLSNGYYSMDTTVMTEAVVGCSAITAKDAEGNTLFGRNYDWQQCKTMIVHTKPENGYESISTVCLDFLGFGDEWLPDAGMANKFMSLAAIYVPLDGMNEKGLCIADLMAGDAELTHQDTEKLDMTTTAAIRMILDHAATVEEAIGILKNIDMHSDIGAAHHFAICDATGRAVVVEYVNNEMYVIESPALTNHYLVEGEKQGVGSDNSHERFGALMTLYDENDGVMSAEQVKEALVMVSSNDFQKGYGGTMWSIVFSPESTSAEFYFMGDFDNPYTVKLGEFVVE